MTDTVKSSCGTREFTAPELARLVNEQHAYIKQQDVLLLVKDQQINQLQGELLAARQSMDPYQVACEIASKPAPSNDDMRRLRAAEVAIAYCGRPKRTLSMSMSVQEHRSSQGENIIPFPLLGEALEDMKRVEKELNNG
jgi:hypothetical protein